MVAGAIWLIDSTPEDEVTAENRHGPVVAPGPQLVHLGDSYASGAGTKPVVPDSSILCQRSELNFGERIAATRKLRIVDVACAGATTAEFFSSQYDGVDPQLDALTPTTEYVTLMIGGNDSAMFTTLVGECSRLAQDDPSGSPCRTELGRKPFRDITGKTLPDVTKALIAITKRAPKAQVLIAGYPRLMPADRACRPAVGIADGDLGYVNRVEAALNTAIRDAAKTAGATFVDMWARSVGHDACQSKATRWIEPQIGADTPIVMHPNARGQLAIANAVAAKMR